MEQFAQYALAGGVIYGIVGGLKSQFPLKLVGVYAWLVNVALGVVLGYFHLFGLNGIESGVIASLGTSTVNTLVNKVSHQ